MITLSECIIRINQILNYPSFTYTDISHFFDQAISEINTTLRIGIPLVSEMIDAHRIHVQDLPNLTLLSSAPTGTATDIPIGAPDATSDVSKVYYNPADSKLYKYDTQTGAWVGYDKMYGIYLSTAGVRTFYETQTLFTGCAIWAPVDEKRLNDFDLNIYLPDDWVILFLIPYVCFKASTRDGGSGALYSEEFIQGFQQLQTSYDVPNFVLLDRVAHLPAYTAEAKKHIAALNIKVPTRAIYTDMKIGNATLPIYGGFNSRGGWGI